MTTTTETTADLATGRVVRNVLTLSVGTLATRVMAALGQVVLAFWLSPAQFGFWASATATTSILVGIANFGEVNAYLARPDASLRLVRHQTRRINVLLAAGVLPIVGLYLAAGHAETAILAMVIGASIPIQGEADVLYAAYVRHDARARLVWAQVAAAVSKTAVGIVIAVAFHSAAALAVSYVALPAVQYLALRRRAREWSRADDVREGLPRRARLAWAFNSLSQTIPLQAGYFVAQFVTTPAVLGVFFLAYQVTIGITGFVSVPLARSALAAFTASSITHRLVLVRDMARIVVGGTTVVVGVLALAATPLVHHVSGQWHDAIPATIILLAGLPVRMLAPLVDAYQQSMGKLRQSTTFNVVDGIGTATAALAGLTHSVLWLAFATTAWKVVFGLVRSAWVLRTTGKQHLAALLVSLTVSSGSLCLAGIPGLPMRNWGYLAAIVVGTAVLIATKPPASSQPVEVRGSGFPRLAPRIAMGTRPPEVWPIIFGALMVVLLTIAFAQSTVLLPALAALICVGCIFSPVGRLLLFVIGGMLVFQNDAAGAKVKVAYVTLIIVCGCIGAASILYHRNDLPKFPRAFGVAIAAIAVVCFIAGMIGLTHGSGLSTCLRDATPYLLILLAPLFGFDASRRMSMRTISGAILVVGAAGAVSFLVAWLGRRHQDVGGAGQFALSSSALVIPAVCLGLSGYFAHGRRNAALMLCSLALAALMLMAGGRSTVFYLGAILLYFLVANGQSLARRLSRGLVLIVVATGSVFLAVNVSRAITGNNFLSHRLSFFTNFSLTSVSQDSSGIVRLRAYSIVHDVFSAHPFAGAGFGYSYTSPATGLPLQDNFTLDTPLLYLAKFGLIGTAALGVGLIAVVMGARNLSEHSGPDRGRMRLFIGGNVAGWLGLLVSGAPTEQKGSGLAIALAICLCASSARRWCSQNNGQSARRPSTSRPALVGAAP